MKICTKCKAKKSPDEFCRMKKAKDGRHYWCRRCRREYMREWRRNHPGYFSSQVKKMRIKHPEKQRARTKIDLLVRKGVIESAKKKDCTDCVEPAVQYDHARGYEPPNDVYVEPVCMKCHGLRSQKRGEHPGRQGVRKISPPLPDGTQDSVLPDLQS